MLRFADIDPERNAAVQIDDGRIELSAHEPRLRFTGDWGISAGDDARFFGTCTLGPSAAPVPASLSMRALADVLTVVLRAVDGRVVMGPAQLHRVARAG